MLCIIASVEKIKAERGGNWVAGGEEREERNNITCQKNLSAGIKTKSVRLEHGFFFLLEVNEYRSTRHVARMRCVRYVRLKWKERSIMPRLTILYKPRGISPPIARIFRSHTFERTKKNEKDRSNQRRTFIKTFIKNQI